MTDRTCSIDGYAAGNETGDATVQDCVPLVAVWAAATVVEGWFA